MKKLTIIILCIMIAVTACNKTEQEPAPIDGLPLQTEPEQNKKVSLMLRTTSSLDPIKTTLQSVGDVMELVYEGLVRLDDNLKPTPALAEGWVIAADACSVEVALRQGVKWHNGSSFTAADVTHTINKIINDPESRYYRMISIIESAVATGTYSVNIRLKSANAGIAGLLNFPITPAKAGVDTWPVGTGPYKTLEVTAHEKCVFVPNPDWWMGVNPNIQRVEAFFIDTDEAVRYSFAANMVNALHINPDELSGYDISMSTHMGEQYANKFEFIGFNERTAVFSSALVRQAVSYALDRTVMVNDFYYGHAMASVLPVHPRSWLNSTEDTGMNLELCRELLFDDGWVDNDNDGKVEKYFGEDLKPLEFELLVNDDNDTRARAADYIASALNTLGFNVKVRHAAWDDYVTLINSRGFDAYLGGINLTADNKLDFLLHSDNAENGQNYAGHSDAQMDAMLAKMKTAADDSSRLAAYGEFQALYMEQMPYAGICFKHDTLLLNKMVTVNAKPTFAGIYKSLYQWSVQ